MASQAVRAQWAWARLRAGPTALGQATQGFVCTREGEWPGWTRQDGRAMVQCTDLRHQSGALGQREGVVSGNCGFPRQGRHFVPVLSDVSDFSVSTLCYFIYDYDIISFSLL